MELDKLILVLLDLSDGCIKGKTLLQKRSYFMSILLEKPVGFKAHYYGPYSPQVDEALAKMKSLDFIEEQFHGYGMTDNDGFEVKRFDYVLTQDGKTIVDRHIDNNKDEFNRIKEVYKRLQYAGDINDHVSLSIAAKIHYISSKNDSILTKEEIEKKAKNLGWNFTQQQFEKANQFLENLGIKENNLK